jgi:hypothetical protein
MKLLRLLRGAIGMGLTWAVGWFGAGVILQWIVGRDVFFDDVPLPIRLAMLGFISGVTFSGVLKVVAGHRRFDELSLGRFAGWGAAGGLLLYGVLAVTAGPGGQALVLAPVLALAGAGSAAGTLSLARKAEAPQQLDTAELIDSGDGTAGDLP